MSNSTAPSSALSSAPCHACLLCVCVSVDMTPWCAMQECQCVADLRCAAPGSSSCRVLRMAATPRPRYCSLRAGGVRCRACHSHASHRCQRYHRITYGLFNAGHLGLSLVVVWRAHKSSFFVECFFKPRRLFLRCRWPQRCRSCQHPYHTSCLPTLPTHVTTRRPSWPGSPLSSATTMAQR